MLRATLSPRASHSSTCGASCTTPHAVRKADLSQRCRRYSVDAGSEGSVKLFDEDHAVAFSQVQLSQQPTVAAGFKPQRLLFVEFSRTSSFSAPRVLDSVTRSMEQPSRKPSARPASCFSGASEEVVRPSSSASVRVRRKSQTHSVARVVRDGNFCKRAITIPGRYRA